MDERNEPDSTPQKAIALVGCGTFILGFVMCYGLIFALREGQQKATRYEIADTRMAVLQVSVNDVELSDVEKAYRRIQSEGEMIKLESDGTFEFVKMTGEQQGRKGTWKTHNSEIILSGKDGWTRTLHRKGHELFDETMRAEGITVVYQHP